MTDKFHNLEKVVGRIRNIFEEVVTARYMPDRAVGADERVQMYVDRNTDEAARKAGVEMQRRLRVEAREQGERERDEKLVALAIELESLRVLLPSLAADACIHLGAVARAKFPKEPAS